VSVTSLPENVVDWVLVSLRSDTSSSSEVARKPAFMLEDGQIVDPSGGPLEFAGVEGGLYYVVVNQRNHVTVMSSGLVNSCVTTGSWDFTTSMSAAYTIGGTPMKDLGDGKLALFAADANVDGRVTAPDFNLWNAASSAGLSGYQQADFNLDGSVTAPDFNLWNANTTTGAASKVPE
jgi:hypothetical protein